MFFKILEALVAQDAEASKKIVREALVNRGDLDSVIRAFFVRAAHHLPSDQSRMDAVVLTAALAALLKTEADRLNPEVEFLVTHLIEFLVELPVEHLDSGVLKSCQAARVVAVQELEEVFEGVDRNHLYGTLQSLLAVMDNKRYFMEVLLSIALRRSPRSVVVVQSTADAVERMDWANHFTPFLLLHAVHVLFDDRFKRVLPPVQAEPDRFELASRSVTSLSQLQYLAILHRIHRFVKTLSSRTEPMIASHLHDLSSVDLCPGPVLTCSHRWINLLIFNSSIQTLSHFPASKGWEENYYITEISN